jgi:KTSC domain
MTRMSLLVAAALLSLPAWADEVEVENHEAMPLDQFECTDTPRSSWIRTICYDEDKRYMLMRERDTWHHFCSIDPMTVAAFIAAPSVGTYYHANVEGRFDCGENPIPKY